MQPLLFSSEFSFPAMDPLFSGLTGLSGIASALRQQGAADVHLRKIFRSWLGRRAWPDEADESLPKRVRAALPALRRHLEGLAGIRLREAETDGGSSKLLLSLSDGLTVECVMLPKDSVCISTQVGCAVGCRFCMTGQGGLVRQLGSAEIVSQAALARSLNPSVRKIDFMGMGEPSHNLRAVLEAVQFLGTYGDFAHKSLMVSSVGDRRLFEALMALPETAVRPALAVSLHASDDEKRRLLLPNAGKMTVSEITEAVEAYAQRVRYPAQYEWVLIDGVNDSEEEIRRLRDLLRGRFAMVNFIPVNENPGLGFRRPSKEKCLALASVLREAGIVAKIRVSAAQGVRGGCGQLRSRVLSEESSR